MSSTGVLIPERPRITGKQGAPRPEPSVPESPYKGLSYYREEDAPFFFGREREAKVVAANAMASRLTVLYGETGVGKSSLLRAGVTRDLMDMARENIERRGIPRLLVAVFPSDDSGATTWRDDPIQGITAAIERAADSLGLDVEPPDPSGSFTDILGAWAERLASDVLLILDQFEEYLLYHGHEDGEGTLAAELPRALRQPNLRVNFVLSIREDMLARLDAFKRRIPTIFDNSVRVSHLDRGDARAAIEKPIDTYNDALGTSNRITIEPDLVDVLLDQLEAGRVVVGLAGVGASDEGRYGDDRPIETPYLQLVMTRLWSEERRAGSDVIRLATLQRLGNSEHIVKSHLDAMMRTLPRYARYVAARVFHHLVTPSGSKIAHTAKDVADYAGVPESDVAPVLDRLTQPQYRILRCVARPGADEGPARYEIFHDVLAAPILDWRSRYLRTRRVIRVVRNWTTIIAQILFGVLCVALLIAYAVSVSPKPLVTVWFAGAMFVWLVSTIVLAKRWKRRDAWAVPLVGLATAFCGIVTGPLSLIVYAVRTVSWLVRRVGAAARPGGRASRRPAEVAGSTARLHRFSGFVSILGAGVILLGCLLPAIEWYDDNEVRHTARLLGSGHRLAFAAVPLACMAMAVIVGVLAIRRPRPRQFVQGLVLGLGVGALTYFFCLTFWPGAIGHFLGVDDFGPGALGAAPLAMAGVALTLVSAAPTYGVEIFASILGARRALLGAGADEMPLDLDRTPWRVRVPIGILGIVAAAVAFVAAFVTSGAWDRPDAKSLFAVSFWAGFQVVVPAATAALAAAVITLGRRISVRGAGCLAGCGATLTALFAGMIAIAGGHQSTGAVLGAAMGVLLMATGIVAMSPGAFVWRWHAPPALAPVKQ